MLISWKLVTFWLSKLLRASSISFDSQFAQAEESFHVFLGSAIGSLALATVGDSQSSTSWQGNEIDQGETRELSLYILSAIWKFTWTVMNHVAGGVHCGQNCFAVDQDLDCWLLCAEETKCDFVETWSNRQDLCLVFFPEEVLRTCVDALSLPWYSIAIRR